jgi:PAS domain S-box-containing protein
MGIDNDSEDKYRILVEQASDGIAIYDRDGKLVEVNTRACEVLGYTRDELLTLNVSDVIAPQSLAETPLRYEALRTGQPLLGERVLLRKDGSSIPVELSARMLSDGRFQVIVRDITQRKVMEQEIRRSRDYYLTLLEDFPALVWQTDPLGTCNYFNHTWLRFRGRVLQEEIGSGWRDGIHPDDIEGGLRTFRAAFEAREPFVMEYRLLRYDGEYRWMRDHGSPFVDLEGNFAGYLGSCYDISEHKSAEEEVHRLNTGLEHRVAERTAQLRAANRDLRAEISERERLQEQVRKQSSEITVQYERLAHIIDEMPVGVFISQSNIGSGEITSSLVNRAGQQLLGRQIEPAGVVNNRSYVFLRPDNTPMPSEEMPMRATLRTGKAAGPTEIVVQYDDGERRTFLLSSALLREENGAREAIVVAQDITDRKRVEDQYARLLESEQQARLEAESAVQVRDELLAIVSHDLKNPLAAIKGNSQLIRRRITGMDGQDVEKALAPVSRVDEAASRMSMLINDLLDFGRLQAGQSLTLQRRPTDLVALVRGAATEFQQTTQQHRIEVVTSLARLVGTWDNTRLEQVLDNLLSNAIKYSPGGGKIRLDISREGSEEGGAWAVVSVRDNGIGISAEDLPHIFEWFRRARNASGRISGAGIGLASANYIVDQHGGKISVASEPGKGATFTMRLPV